MRKYSIRHRVLITGTALLFVVGYPGDAASEPRAEIGQEVSVPVHLRNGQEFEMKIRDRPFTDPAVISDSRVFDNIEMDRVLANLGDPRDCAQKVAPARRDGKQRMVGPRSLEAVCTGRPGREMSIALDASILRIGEIAAGRTATGQKETVAHSRSRGAGSAALE